MAELDYIPPQDLELEKAVLGAMLLSGESVVEVVDILTPECFYNQTNYDIYEKGILPIYYGNTKVDILTVNNQLQKEGLNLQLELSLLADRIGGAGNVQEHVFILKELAIKRGLIKLSAEISKSAYQPEIDALELLDTTARNIDAIGLKIASKPFKTMDKLVSENIKEIENAATKKGGLTGIPAGFEELDRLTSGWQDSDLIILAARPSMGKSTLALNLAENAAIDFNKKVAFFSLEMSASQLCKKSIASRSGVDLNKLRRGEVDSGGWDKINSSIDSVGKAGIFIDDQAGITVFEITTKLRRLKHDHPELSLVFIDYLQLIGGGDPLLKNQNREQQISYISRSLKGLAKELDLPIIALSQLSRGVESRSDKKPVLSDLRDSGAIEQDADLVIFIYRPAYYDILQDANGNDISTKALISISKHRNGSTGDVYLEFDGQGSKFSDARYNVI